jgi:hypothetical protein
MTNSSIEIIGVVIIVACSTVLLQQFVIANDELDYTPNCYCPSKDKFPPPNSHGFAFGTWCGYELGPECDIQRGYICYLNMTNKLAKGFSTNCLGVPRYCIPLNINLRFKTCGEEWQCAKIPSWKKSINATKIALEKLRKTYG